MSARQVFTFKSQQSAVPADRHERQPAQAMRPSGAVAANDTVFLRERELLARLPFSHATLWRRIKDKAFPEPFRLSPRVTAWRLSDVELWSATLPGSMPAEASTLQSANATSRRRHA